VLTDFITTRSSGNVDVYQTSSSGAQGPRIGGNVNRELRNALLRADALILVYTRQEGDWSYCMWECGVATDPASEDTHVIVFQCGDDLPRVFADQVAVDARDQIQVRRFAAQFLTGTDFFPDQRQPLTGFQPNDLNVERAAQALFEELEGVLPDEPHGVEEWPALPYLQIEIGGEVVQRIQSEQQPDNRTEMARSALLDAPIAGGDTQAARLFGMPTLPGSEPLRKLLDVWTGAYPDQEPDWLTSLAEQVTRAVQWQFPAVRWSVMRSTDQRDQTWYAPFLAHVRRFASRAMQFDIYFQKFADESDSMISVSAPRT
jgi:hypothetical protein